VRIWTVMLTLLVLSSSAWAEGDTARILTLAQWRDQQLTSAQNRLVRVSNRITRIRQSTGNLDEIAKLEKERQAALHSAELIGEFTIEDYLNVYLNQFVATDADLVEIAKGLTKKEVAQMLKILFRRSSAMAGSEAPSPTLTNLTDPGRQGI
jgi:hypothetical protein